VVACEETANVKGMAICSVVWKQGTCEACDAVWSNVKAKGIGY